MLFIKPYQRKDILVGFFWLGFFMLDRHKNGQKSLRTSQHFSFRTDLAIAQVVECNTITDVRSVLEAVMRGIDLEKGKNLGGFMKGPKT